VFFLGSGLAQLPTGILADRYGRKPVLWAGLGLYIAAAIVTTFASSLEAMLVCRFVWGVGASAPRTVCLAMVRDRFQGSKMAQTMSYVQAVFVIVPVLAPSLGKVVLDIFGWRGAVVAPGMLSLILAAWLLRIPESLPVEGRRPVTFRHSQQALREVIRIPRTVLLAIALTMMLGSINAYIGLAETIIDKTYDREGSFSIIFGCIAATMGVAGLLNAKLVGRFGMKSVLRVSPSILLSLAALFLALSLSNRGAPPFLLFCVLMAAVLAVQTMVFPNVNALALQPVGHIAGLASGLIGSVSTIGGALVGILVTQSHRGGTSTLALGIATCSAIAFLLTRLALNSSEMTVHK
jgi:MFS transporter, DHA1 family, multidrug resistance protein